MSEIWKFSATALSAMIQRRELSAREAASAALARLEDVNPYLNAVIDHNPADVIAQADAVDAAIAAGDDVGPLAGVPVTVKVSIDQAGYATTNGLALQRNKIALSNSPVVDNFRRAGAVILGRTNAPAMSLRWFTNNKIHGATLNPRDSNLTPGGSSGGAAVAVAAGIGHLAHGTDIGGSIRYPAYTCGVHGLRPTLGRVATWNASSADRGIGPQLMAVSGPIARTIADLRLGLKAMAASDSRDPWWVPVPLEGPETARRVSLCLRPDGLTIVPEVEAALYDAAKRLEAGGWVVEEIADTPPLQEASNLQLRLWLGDNFAAFVDTVKREGDPGALAVLEYVRPLLEDLPSDFVSQALVRRAGLTREWLLFLERHPVLLLPVSGELPFPDALDLESPESFDRVWRAQLVMTGLPFMGLPGLTVSTGTIGKTPIGVQLVAGRYREDLCLLAGETIELGGGQFHPSD